MCRFIFYNGPAVTMSKICIEPEHGILQQSIKAFCAHTPINADGFGVSWYTPGINVPGVFKDVSPAWNNANLKHITRSVKSPMFFAHVRAASTGGVNYPNCHPFVYKNLSFMHNGTASYFKQIKRQMLAFISDRAFQLIQGTTDSEMMFAMFVTNFEKLLQAVVQIDSNISASKACPSSKDDYHQTPGHGMDDPFSYTLEGDSDETQTLSDALRLTLHQVHTLILEYEYNSGIQSKPSPSFQGNRVDEAALNACALPFTKGIGRLNLAVSDGKSSCVARYVTSPPETAHTLYYSTGKEVHCTDQMIKMVKDERVSSSSDKHALCTIVSSEPLASCFECEPVPVNHMVVNGPKGYFSIDAC